MTATLLNKVREYAISFFHVAISQEDATKKVKLRGDAVHSSMGYYRAIERHLLEGYGIIATIRTVDIQSLTLFNITPSFNKTVLSVIGDLTEPQKRAVIEALEEFSGRAGVYRQGYSAAYVSGKTANASFGVEAHTAYVNSIAGIVYPINEWFVSFRAN